MYRKRKQRCDIYIVQRGRIIAHDFNISIKRIREKNDAFRRRNSDSRFK